MGGIFGKKPKPPTIKQTYRFSDTDTTKEPGLPLKVIYGRAFLNGNVVKRTLTNDSQHIEQFVSLCWGPVVIDERSIRINEKIPEYINGARNPEIDAISKSWTWVSGASHNLTPGTTVSYGGKYYRRNRTYVASTIGNSLMVVTPPPEAPMYWTEVTPTEVLPGVRVYTHNGALNQAPAHGLDYGMNRTAYLYIVADANDKVQSVDKVEVFVERPHLFVFGGDYTTPAPSEILAAFPSGIRSSNPVAAALDYMLNKDFGAARDPEIFGDFATWIEAIQHCEPLVSAGSIGKEHRWSVGIALGDNKDDTHADLIERLLDHAQAKYFESGGITKCWIARAKTAVGHLDLSNFEPRGLVTTDMMEIPNIVEVEYRAANADSEKRKVVWEDPGRIEDWKEVMDRITLEGCPSRTQASRMARLHGRRALAERKTISGICDQQFFTLEPGDVVTVTLAYPDSTWFVDKKFWVDEIIPETRDGDVDITLREYGDDSLYDDGMANVIEANDPIRSSGGSGTLANPNQQPLNPPSVSFNTGYIDRRPSRLFYIDLTWTMPPEPLYMHQRFNIYRRESLSDPWQMVHSVSSTQLSWRDYEADPVTKEYYYAVISETSLGRQGEFPETYHAYSPKLILDPPPMPLNPSVTLRRDSLREIRWNAPNPLPADFEGYVVTVNPGTTFEESFAVPAHDGVLTATKCTTDKVSAVGDWVIAIRSKDWFGNLSDPLIVQYTTEGPTLPDRFLTQRFRGMTRLEFTWNSGNEPLNIAGMELRYHDKESVDWATAQPLINGVVGGPSIELPLLPSGRVTVLGKSVDTFGNRSDDYVAVVFESQGITLSNVVQDIDHRALGFPGTKIGCSVVSGDLVANSSGELMYDEYNEKMFYTDDEDNFYTDTFSEMVYETTFTVQNEGMIYIEKEISGDYAIDFIQPIIILMYENDASPMYTDDEDLMYDPVQSEYETWPGVREVLANETYGFRVRVAPGKDAGVISKFKVIVDVPDLYEDINDLFVPSGGIRVPLTKDFQDVKGVSITLQHVVPYTSAVSSKIIDKDPNLGPLIQCFDAGGDPVSAYVDVTVKGY